MLLSLFGFAGALLALVAEDDEEHIAGEPEGGGHGDGGKGGLHLRDQGIGRKGERAKEERHHNEDADCEHSREEVMAFA